jgi:hypothetical protein
MHGLQPLAEESNFQDAKKSDVRYDAKQGATKT